MLTLDFSNIRLVCLIAWFSEQDQKYCSGKSGARSQPDIRLCLINHMPDQNQAAAWSIRLLPDQNQAAARTIRHMPDQNQVAAWSIRLLPDQNQACLISGKPLSLINPAQANQAIRQTKEIHEKCSVQSWMNSMETIGSSHKILYRDLPLYKDHEIRRATAGEPTLLE